MKERFISDLKKSAVITTAGIILYLLVVFAGVKLPCVFNRITGLLCPGCGITRMIISITRFDFAGAYGYNKALFVTSPVIALIFAHMEYRYIRYGTRKLNRFVKVMLWCEIVLLIVFGIARNII